MKPAKMYVYIQVGMQEVKFISASVCNSHMVPIPIIWTVWYSNEQ